MTMQKWVPVVAVLVAIVGLVAQFRWHRRAGTPAFSIARTKTRKGWRLRAANDGDAPTRRLWAELVSEAGGRVLSVAPAIHRHVAVDAEVEFTVVEAAHVTGYGVELCWLEGRGRERRRRVALPHRGSGSAA